MAARGRCIGLTGRMGSGKGEVARLLERRGFRYASLSDIVRAEAARSGGGTRRDDMQDIGNRLRAEGGAGVLARRVREAIEADPWPRWVIDGIRNPAEVLELRQMESFRLVAVACALETILERMRRRGRATDAVSEAELRVALEREWGRGEPAGGQQVGPTMAMADFTIDNNGALAGLESRVDEVLAALGAGHE